METTNVIYKSFIPQSQKFNFKNGFVCQFNFKNGFVCLGSESKGCNRKKGHTSRMSKSDCTAWFKLTKCQEEVQGHLHNATDGDGDGDGKTRRNSKNKKIKIRSSWLL